MRENKYLWYAALAMFCWALYAATFDTSGKFDPSTHFDVIEYRIGHRLGMVAEGANRSIEETNHEMQDTVNSRKRRVDRRVEEHSTQ